MATLSKTYGIKLSFNRDPKTSALFLVLKGGKESVTAAQEEVDTIAEVSLPFSFFIASYFSRLINFCQSELSKKRYRITWIINFFETRNLSSYFENW